MKITEADLKRLAALFAQQAIEYPPSDTHRRSRGKKWEPVDLRRHRLLAGLDGVAELLEIYREPPADVEAWQNPRKLRGER